MRALATLGSGRHVLPVTDGLPATAAVELSWSGAREGAVAQAVLLASPVGRRQGPSLSITHPPDGDPAVDGVYLRGWLVCAGEWARQGVSFHLVFLWSCSTPGIS